MDTNTYIVVPFSPDGLGTLRPGRPQALADCEMAIETARHLLHFDAGVIVLEQAGDEFTEPKLVTAIGRVPEDLVAQLAA